MAKPTSSTFQVHGLDVYVSIQTSISPAIYMQGATTDSPRDPILLALAVTMYI